MSFRYALMSLAAVTGLPYWLPQSMKRMRMRLFRQLFGSQGIELPNEKIDAQEALRVYSRSESSGVVKGSLLSELFFYWSFPGAPVHQEQVEPGPRYDAINRTTRKILALRPETLLPKLERHFDHYSATKVGAESWTSVRLTRWLFPTFAALYYELIFGEEGDDETVALLTAYVSNDLRTLKCLELPDRPLRLQARDRLKAALNACTKERLLPASDLLNDQELSEYLLVNFFSTGVIQLSEALAHVLLEVGKNQEIRVRLGQEGYRGTYFSHVVKEILRLYPLFDSSQRILREKVVLSNGEILEEGTVLHLNHVAYNRSAYAEGEKFKPERWQDADLEKISIGFGVKKNRSCPAQGFAANVLGLLLPRILERFDFRSTANHTRPIINFAPCRVKRKEAKCPEGRVSLLAMKVLDDWRAVALAASQMFLGKFMAWDALRTRPCAQYFEAERASVAASQGGAIVLSREK